jgi:hypothetical protein
MQTYYYLLASQKFLIEEEPLQEVFDERHRYYKENQKEVDFWFVKQPAFLDAPEMAQVKAQCPQPCAAIISTNQQFIQWFKLRLEHVLMGTFAAPSATISDPIASVATVGS